MTSILSKICGDCKTDKPLDSFYKKPGAVSGVSSRCKECEKAYQAGVYQRNKAIAQSIELPPGYTKKCNSCKATMPAESFGKHIASKDGLRNKCRVCAKAYDREYYEKNQDRIKSRVKKYDRVSGSSNRRMKVYGITPERYSEMLSEVGGMCEICGRDPYSVSKYGPCVDHCHESGNVRGILCVNCNTALGSFRDDQEVILKALEYLRSHTR